VIQRKAVWMEPNRLGGKKVQYKPSIVHENIQLLFSALVYFTLFYSLRPLLPSWRR